MKGDPKVTEEMSQDLRPTLYFLISTAVHIHVWGQNGGIIYCPPGEHPCQQGFRRGSVNQKVTDSVHMQ